MASNRSQNHALITAFLAFVHKQQLLPQQGATLLAVSGGVDSVVMSTLFHQAQLPFAIAHCNFGLRGAASDQDEAWVRALAQQYEVCFYTRSFDVATYAQENGVSVQMAARTLRYAWFEALCKEHGFEKVATAHHHNDRLETVLLNLTKGTGIAGLHGILPVQGRCIRPLVFAHKEEILAYAQAQKLTWREDSSNAKDTYQRNLIRNQVVPILKQINPNLEATSSLTVERLHQTEAIFDEQVTAVGRQILRQQGDVHYVAIHEVQDKVWAPVVLHALLQPWGFNFIQLKALLAHKHASGTMIQSASHQLHVDRDQWIITPCTQPASATYSIDEATQLLSVPSYVLQCACVPRSQYSLVADKAIAALDQASLRFPLAVRPWQPGDAFYPLGMQHRKKVSDFLIDSKVPVPMKAQVLVVTSAHQIVWVVGHRIDDRFKLTDSTQQVYELRLKTAKV
ncbi:MAG: tRNA lysidine(34) synthetase TilS [Roseivirga sp.]